MIDKNFTYALVGASNDHVKYGNKIFLDLHNAGYKVSPINLHDTDVEGVKAFKSLSDVPEKIDVVIFVIPPLQTEKVLVEVHRLGIKNVWLQPGASSDDAVTFCKENGISCMHDMCIMVRRLN